MSPGKAHGLGPGETHLGPREQAGDLPPQLVEQPALGPDAGVVDPPDGLRARVHGCLRQVVCVRCTDVQYHCTGVSLCSGATPDG